MTDDRDHIQCPRCSGTGRDNWERCNECGGAGSIPTDFYDREIEGAQALNEEANRHRGQVGRTDEYLEQLAKDAADASKEEPNA